MHPHQTREQRARLGTKGSIKRGVHGLRGALAVIIQNLLPARVLRARGLDELIVLHRHGNRSLLDLFQLPQEP